MIEIHYHGNKDVGRTSAQNCLFLNRYNCLISLQLGTEYDHVTAGTLQTFKVKESKVKITA